MWAPNARGVRVVGDFNYWNGTSHPMRSMGSSGVWELYVPGVSTGSRYKYEILGLDGVWRQKADPLARRCEMPPANASVIDETHHLWTDAEWMEKRAKYDPYHSPMSVYELHLASWRPGLDYQGLAEQLPPYLNELGFTHVEFLPPTEHPFGGSWGYQVSSYFAPTARLGSPDDEDRTPGVLAPVGYRHRPVPQQSRGHHLRHGAASSPGHPPRPARPLRGR